MEQKDERLWGAMAHIIPLVVSYVTGFGWVAALVMYFVYKDKSRFVAFNALQVLYFHVFLFLIAIISVPLIIVVIGIFMLIAVGILGLVLTILGAIKASNGEIWEYPVVGKMARATVGI